MRCIKMTNNYDSVTTEASLNKDLYKVNNIVDIELQNNDKTFEIDESIAPLIPEGVYICKFNGWETHRVRLFGNAEKLVLHLTICEVGHELYGTKLRAFYNVKIKGKPGKSGNFKAPMRGKFMIDFCNCFPHVKIRRHDRIPMSYLTKELIKVKVETTISNRDQEKLPKALHYSSVRKLVGIQEL